MTWLDARARSRRRSINCAPRGNSRRQRWLVRTSRGGCESAQNRTLLTAIEEVFMNSVTEALRLLKRSAEIAQQARQRGTLALTEEQELLAIEAKLQHFPAAVSAIKRTALG